MIITVDIGNTTVTVGVFAKTKVREVYFIDTDLTLKSFKGQLKKLLHRLKKKYSTFEGIVVCSVVPRLSKVVQNMFQSELGIKPHLVGQAVKVPIHNNYKNPKQVGQDRLICAYAAKTLYGAPILIIDFGTATTFDLVSSRGSYEGGIIVPGIRLSAEALFRKTALLPKIHRIKGPQSLIGKDTQGSILSGLFYGYGAMCRGLIELVTRKNKGKLRVVITGGYTGTMKKFISKKIDHVDKNLALKGMALLYLEKNK